LEGQTLKTKQIPLTAAEISTLWTSLITNSMGTCILKYFLAKAEDDEAESLINAALSISQQQYHQMKQILLSESIAIPLGFTDEDLNVDAPRLFSDSFTIQFVKQIANIGMMSHSSALYVSAREDIRELYNNSLASWIELDNKSTMMLLSKGIYVRPPFINPPTKNDFVKDQSFLTGWLGERRPLTGLEITDLYINILLNSIGKALIMGYSQVAQTKDVQKYFIRGKQLAAKQMTVFSSVLIDEDIDVPPTYDSHVTDSTISPFSEKLMLFHVTILNGTGILNYGASISTSPRRDLASHYTRLLPDILLYAEDGINLLIKHGWMEEPPKATDWNSLVKQ